MGREMKDSGIEWIGEIPKSWELITLDKITKNHYSGGTPTATNPDYYNDDGAYFVNISDLTESYRIQKTKKRITEEGIKNKNLKKVEKGSFLYAMYASVGKHSLADIDVYISQAILSFRERKDIIDKVFLSYFLNVLEDYVDFYSNGTTQINLNAEIMKKIKTLLPPLKEQEKIVKYLDEQVKKLDNIIRLTKESINKYKEYKKSLIYEAVTKGLDKNIKMKDTGIEWIGEIPEGWELITLDKITKNHYSGGTPTATNPDYYNDDGAYFINISDLTESYRIQKTKKRITEEGIKNKNLKKVEKGSFLYAMYASVGKHSLADIDVYISQAILSFRERKDIIDKVFLSYFLNVLEDYVDFYSNGTTQINLNAEIVKKIKTLLPPLKEQKEIAEYLDEKTKYIDEIILKKEQFVEKLEEYKKSLIFEVVTGKKEI